MCWEKLSFWLGQETHKLTWPRNCLSNAQFGWEFEGKEQYAEDPILNGQLLFWDHRPCQYKHTNHFCFLKLLIRTTAQGNAILPIGSTIHTNNPPKAASMHQ